MSQMNEAFRMHKFAFSEGGGGVITTATMPDYARYNLCGFLGALTVPHAISRAVNRTLSAAPSADRYAGFPDCPC
ncbi:hypothetical protein B296_00017034 [Ensete ventricosum]|uniref:Uncharacterized protein n=1 Tax=Ensete ventricosum TaxID=4639 RepID=A0A427AW89_ENSVE|nr:hypothetical protein B296_00017034 [Ensete ventricosum]